MHQAITPVPFRQVAHGPFWVRRAAEGQFLVIGKLAPSNTDVIMEVLNDHRSALRARTALEKEMS